MNLRDVALSLVRCDHRRVRDFPRSLLEWCRDCGAVRIVEGPGARGSRWEPTRGAEYAGEVLNDESAKN
jgi:hypothetical protein